jgi:hypothetical protein
MAQSVTGICNRALQLVGSAQQIMNLTDNTREARACTRAYDACRRAELRSHPWNFAVKRAQLAANLEGPPFGPVYQFPLPVDCVRVIVPKGAACDWNVEGRNIVATTGTPLDIRYISDVEDPTIFDAMFCEALAHRIALAIVEDMTQSNTKKAGLKQDYKDLLVESRKVDAIESVPERAAESEWTTSRYLDSSAIWQQS